MHQGSDTTDLLADEIEQLAERLLRDAQQAMRADERRQSAQMARLIEDPKSIGFTIAMVDQLFRSDRPKVQSKRLRAIIQEHGVPRYFPLIDRILLHLGSSMSRFFPGSIMPWIAQRMRADSRRVILDSQPQSLKHYLKQRSAAGFSINLNHLGEAVLGEQEAQRRLETVIDSLKQSDVQYVSVKISAIYSQINLVAWDESLDTIQQRLRKIYRVAQQNHKFVNLDMEEYRDLELTLAAFQNVLSEPEFQQLSAGIALQAYLPDSWPAQQQLTQWAQQRVHTGGAPIKIRLVKGANLAMEAVEAEQNDWAAAPYASKVETDANYRRMLEFGCRTENAFAVKLGVASHNLFDLAAALLLREKNQTCEQVEIEMIEGMVNHQARVIRDAADGLLFYAPVVNAKDYQSALAYLVRRLDENTAPENFLHDLFSLSPGSDAWEKQRDLFKQGWQLRNTVSSDSNRGTQISMGNASETFQNQPDSDWTQISVRQQAYSATKDWRTVNVPKSRALSTQLNRLQDAQPGWNAQGVTARAKMLNKIADLLLEQRFKSIACISTDGKKTIAEADAEVSEAIDFARYYAASFEIPAGLTTIPYGVVVVTSPWNFPYAIACGGVLAALMAGNTVLLKPASATQRTAWHLVNQLWQAGISQDVLQFCSMSGQELGSSLAEDSRVNAMTLTGSIETAEMFRACRPALPLFAETSGKNSLIVTAQSDRELAIKDIVKSAFGHSGQKCSAASLLILEKEVYEDKNFFRQLKDATQSLHVGPAADRQSVVTPLVQQPQDKLLRGLTQLEPHEKWLVEPKQLGEDSCLWSPGIRVGVEPGSWFHQTECFGPVLGVMCANDLAQAVQYQNETEYGLTAGLHSLDRTEQNWWVDKAQAGNLYINRSITGAIVQRQPFGGWKKSSIGPGAKAGGPNYVSMLVQWRDTEANTSMAEVEASYQQAWRDHYSQSHDFAGLKSESNLFRYRPCQGVLLRASERETATIERAQLASRITGTPLFISYEEYETDAKFIQHIQNTSGQFDYLRTTALPSDSILTAIYQASMNWINAPLPANGQLELRNWLLEQSISTCMHRYGQLIEKR
ncbi:MAG: 1-pyrroline-5-carboxylate dehydrogenase [Blastopirellula sp.]|nr:MAG: 1-pyrroline-5-carboxylate dehydrogenase [Blastopirellula sp.]